MSIPWFDTLRAAHIAQVVVRVDNDGGAPRGRYSVHTTQCVPAGDILFVEEAHVYACEISVAHAARPFTSLVDSDGRGEQSCAAALLAHVDNDRQRLIALDMPPRACSKGLDYAAAPLAEIAAEMHAAYALPLTMCGSGLRYGSGFFQRASRINHACQPNCAYVAHGKWVIFYALHKIAPGDEIVRAYAREVTYLPYPLRARCAVTKFGFDCVCAQCTTERAHTVGISTDYRSAHNRARAWRQQMTTTCAPTNSARGMFQHASFLTRAYLDSYGAETRQHPLIHGFVTSVLARALVPVFPGGMFQAAHTTRELAGWIALYKLAYPYLISHSNVAWYKPLYDLCVVVTTYCLSRSVLVAECNTMPSLFLTSVVSRELAEFAADQYETFTVDAVYVHVTQSMREILALAMNRV